ncbi:hypothetical protein HPB47_000083 [Ixodes persulcatus]|uniref:Uncharacterized protein n=1 Tax=Ixodes persulcatus TaxID=34615 RepID=A0AC60PU38_IXOPE|nr:hypothetical protein HPB47_000083 [Ixodes persulcatus]
MPPQLRKRPAPPSDALPTVSQCRWELRRFATSHYCLEISTAKDAYSFLSNIGAYADLPRFFKPCTKCDGQSCHLLDQIDIWNQFLQEVGMLLEEVAPGTLSVAPQHRASDGFAMEHCNPDGWVLLHWLFKEHRCIANLRLLSPNKRSQLHLGNALSQNSGLRTLTLSYETSEEELRMINSTVRRWTKLESLNISGLALSNDTAVLLEASLEKLPSLRSLDVSFLNIAPACDAELLKGVFERMSALTSLTLSYTFAPPDVALVLRCLGPGLSELSVDDTFLVPQEGAVFQEFLSGNTVLKKLTLIQKVCTGMGELDNVFKSLLVNHSLEELHLSDFGIENPTMELLAEAVVEHSTLKILEVNFFDECWEMDGTPLAKMLGQNKSIQELKFEVGEVACYGAFAEAVRKNTTLKKLSLNLVQLDDLAEIFVYRGFLEALSCNGTIQQVTLGSIYSVLVSQFSELLRETGTERRVTFEVDLSDAELFTEALEKCSGLAEMSYSDWGSKIPVPPSAYRHLMRYYNLEDLDISLWDQPMDDEAVTHLAEFLASTRTLQSVRLCFHISPAATHALLNSISCNRSISSLLISRWTFNELNANLLWQILRNTDILNEIFLSLYNNSDFKALSQFPERLLDNHSLLSAGFSDFQDFKLKVKDVMRRNLSTLYRAVMFVMGSRGRRYAEAFERVSRSPALVKEVQKSASESKEDAKERVRWAKDYLNQHFLAAAGVVKDTVTCTENGQLQLDQIGLDSWLHIRRYLEVADIKEPTDQPSMSRHLYKKRRSRR